MDLRNYDDFMIFHVATPRSAASVHGVGREGDSYVAAVARYIRIQTAPSGSKALQNGRYRKLAALAQAGERDAALARADRERREADEARAAADAAAMLREEGRRLKDRTSSEDAKRKAFQADEADDLEVPATPEAVIAPVAADVMNRPRVSVMHHAGRWKLAKVSSDFSQAAPEARRTAQALVHSTSPRPFSQSELSPMASTSEEKVLPDQQAAWAAQEELSSPAA